MKNPYQHIHQNDADLTLVPPDPRVVAVLRDVTGEPPYHLVDWDTLRASIVGDAAALLTRTIRRSWMTYISRWSSTIVPAGIAASILATFLMFRATGTAQTVTTGDTALSPAAILGTVTGISSGKALSASVTEPLPHGVSVEALLAGDTR